MLEYKNASEEFAPQITKLVQETIASVYPKYYPKEVVDFFAGLHCEDAVRKAVSYTHLLMRMALFFIIESSFFPISPFVSGVRGVWRETISQTERSSSRGT